MKEINTNFDKSKYYLGTVCKRGHDYEGTGMSLRYKSNKENYELF